jgi:transmembrane sensor
MSSRPPARHFEPEVTEARVARQWAALERSLDRPRATSWRWPVFVVVAAAMASVVVAFLRGRADDRLIEGAVLESVAGQTITIADGSRVQLARDARMRVGSLSSKRVELALERGAAVFDVKHDPARRFVVHAGAVDVEDEGTRFEVDLAEGAAVTVVVEQGSVSVQRRGVSEPPRVLSAGDRWWTGQQGADGRMLGGGLDAGEPAAPAPSDSTMAPPVASSNEPGPIPPIAVPSVPSISSKELLDVAQRAQRDGRTGDAAHAYDRLRRHFRTDPRAGLAAFELGRLRLGALGDPLGAAEALQDAVALSPRAPFREDAEARLVEALDAAGDAARCEHARDAYLSRYPQGLHADAVSARCGHRR